MNKQELLDFINKTWPLGVSTDSDIPKLRFQRNEKLIQGYSLNFSKSLEIDKYRITDEFKELFISKHVKNEDLYEIINSTLLLFLTKVLLEYKDIHKRMFAVGHCKNGKPVIFISDDYYSLEPKPTKYKEYWQDYTNGFPFIKIFFDNFHICFNEDFGNPFKYKLCFGAGKKEGILKYLPGSYNYMVDNRFRLVYGCYLNEQDYFTSSLNQYTIEQESFIGFIPIRNSNLIYTDIFTPNHDNFDYTLDYLFYNNKIIFLNGFDLTKYYEHNLELINKFCEFFPATKTYKDKFNHCKNQVLSLLKGKEIIEDFCLDKILDISELTGSIETFKYWIVKESCYNNYLDDKEIFPKDLILSTKNINKKTYIDTLLIDGNIEMNVYGIDKLRKIPYNKIEPIKDKTIEIDAEKNRLLWANRDRLLFNDFGKFDYFVSTKDEIDLKDYYIDLFSSFIYRFTTCYLDSNNQSMRDVIKDYLEHIEYTATRNNDNKYTKIVEDIKSELETNDLVDAVCIFAQYWNLKLDYSEYAENITENIIKYLSTSVKINDMNLLDLEKFFKISYMNSFIDEKDRIKASKIRNLMNSFFNEKELDCYEKRKIIYDFRSLIGLKSYERKLNENIKKRMKEISSYSLFSLFKINKDTLFLKIKNNLITLVENFQQLPKYEQKSNLFLDLENTNNFASLNSVIEKYSLFIPEIIRNKLSEITEKMSITDKIKLDGFKQKTATLLINIYYDLERSKEYTVDELKTVWAKRNAELEYNTKVEYSFEVTLNNLLKAGILKTNDENYTVNV